jgi:hypothetical protein
MGSRIGHVGADRVAAARHDERGQIGDERRDRRDPAASGARPCSSGNRRPTRPVSYLHSWPAKTGNMAIELALRYLGLGQPELVEADDQDAPTLRHSVVGRALSPITAAALVAGVAIVISAVAGRTTSARHLVGRRTEEEIASQRLVVHPPPLNRVPDPGP